jgi:hypothetical protein
VYQDEVILNKGQSAPFSGMLVPRGTWLDYQAYEINFDKMKEKTLTDQEAKAMAEGDGGIKAFGFGLAIGFGLKFLIDELTPKDKR